MRFNLQQVIYATALVATSLSVFGLFGIVLAAVIAALWVRIGHDRNQLVRNYPPSVGDDSKQRQIHSPTLIELLVITGIIGTLVGLLLPPTGHLSPWRFTRRSQESMEQVIGATRRFQARHGRLPQDVPTADGRQLTWRVELLPELGDGELIEEYGSLPDWNGAAEQKLAAEWPFSLMNWYGWYEIDTTYAAVRGRDAWWDTQSQAAVSEDADNDDRHTVALILDENAPDPWYLASDVTFDEALRYLTRDDVRPGVPMLDTGFFHKPCQPRVVAFADRAVRIFYAPLPEDLARAILTARGGESVDRALLERLARPQVNWSRIYAVFLFALVAVYPVWLLWRRRRSAKRAAG